MTPGAEGPCPRAPKRRDRENGGSVIEALGAAGFRLDGGAQRSGDYPVFDVVFMGPGARWALSASWLDARLWDLRGEIDPIAATERSTVGPLSGVLALLDAEAVVFGAGGLMHLSVDPQLDVPRLVLSGHEFVTRASAGEPLDANLLATNRGSAPLRVEAIELDGQSVSLRFEVYSLDGEPPTQTPFDLGKDATVLLTVTVTGQQGDPHRGTLTLRTSDPDRPVVRLPVVAGRRPLIEGDPAPAFTLPDLDGRPWSSTGSAARVMHLKFFNGL